MNAYFIKDFRLAPYCCEFNFYVCLKRGMSLIITTKILAYDTNRISCIHNSPSS